jgi:tRNA threonylcarbamoyladenosine biosynthesis protein TsaB
VELSLDTASDLASVALSNEGRLVSELTWRCRANHSVEVLPAIDHLLTSSGVDRADITAVFVCRGPGSYGGLRAGLSLAMSFAAALRIEILGAGRLEIDAYQHSAYPGPICAVHRAGRGEVAWAAYRALDGELDELHAPGLALPEDLRDSAPPGALYCGEVDGDLAQLLEERDPNVVIASPSASVRRAGSLAELAWRRFSRGERVLGGFVEPLYLREPNITKAKPRL